jgi:hypothetical protein
MLAPRNIDLQILQLEDNRNQLSRYLSRIPLSDSQNNNIVWETDELIPFPARQTNLSPRYINIEHPDLLDPTKEMWPEEFQRIAHKPETEGGIKLFIEHWQQSTS